jgi:hypothetical protein
MNAMVKKAGGIAIGIALVVGYMQYSKRSNANEIRQRATSLCAGDKECLEAVDAHFEGCFDANYRPGGRRRAASFNTAGFSQCVNQKAGKEIFATSASP